MKKLKYVLLALIVTICPFAFYACDFSEQYTFVSFNDFKTEYYVGQTVVGNSNLIIKNSNGEIITLKPGEYIIEGDLSTSQAGEHKIKIKYDDFSYTLTYTVYETSKDVTTQEIIEFLKNRLENFYLTNSNISLSITPNLSIKYLNETELVNDVLTGSINFDELCQLLFNEQGSVVKMQIAEYDAVINQAVTHITNIYNSISTQNWAELETNFNSAVEWLEDLGLQVSQGAKDGVSYILTQLKNNTEQNLIFDALELIYQREITETEQEAIIAVIQDVVYFQGGQKTFKEVKTTVVNYLTTYFPSLNITEYDAVINQGIQHVSEIYSAVSSKNLENIKSSLQSTIDWLEENGVNVPNELTTLLNTKEQLINYLAYLSKETNSEQLEIVKQELNNVIQQINNNEFNQALNSIEALLTDHYSEESQTIFKSILTIYVVATNNFDDVDLNELLSFVELPNGISIDYNQLYKKLKSTLTSGNIISLASAKTELFMVDGEYSGVKLVLTFNFNLDVEIASITGSVKVEIN